MKRLLFTVLILLFSASLSFAATQELKFEWQANPVGDHVVGYNIYKSATASGPWEKLNPELIPGTTYTEEISEALEETMYFYCTASDGNLESDPSNIVSGVIDTIPPGAPGGMTITISIKIGE